MHRRERVRLDAVPTCAEACAPYKTSISHSCGQRFLFCVPSLLLLYWRHYGVVVVHRDFVGHPEHTLRNSVVHDF